MMRLRCEGQYCRVLTKAARLEYELELAEGRCLCREALERMDHIRGAPSSPHRLPPRRRADSGSEGRGLVKGGVPFGVPLTGCPKVPR